MGVPALFRWLSKKYPKIIYPVQEEDNQVVDGDINIPIDISRPNPNGLEFDNLYLDMNGIVHPCTHPEGKPAPDTEEEMMVEVFKYTERVVNMIRPRRLLFMAIDGVAPRAKMNQQRSRRFRSARETQEREEARKESLELWKAMGKTVTEEEEHKVPWDSNAITPGTPFMTLLASSLRYWVVQKINNDPGWKTIQVVISDASVPGEGEHKIMDFIRRQRSHSGYDPNTRHVIYGLDADLIMLALATHEPQFRVLREDVFANDNSPTACRLCGQEGHYAAQCQGSAAPVKKSAPEKKPFIFLDVSILREYLEVELNVLCSSFPFSLEQAIDDWVLLIFFVGNDFLPHLPSLEIREGAIDMLLKIWKQELSRMGGYLTCHGQLELSRVQIILEGLARREDEIFRKRREAEERQDQNAKRRKLDNEKQVFKNSTASSSIPHPSLPPRPSYDFAAKADSIGLGVAPTPQSIQHVPIAAQALAGSNRDIVANRRAIRMANLSAAEVLKAEISGADAIPSLPSKPVSAPPPDLSTTVTLEASPMSTIPLVRTHENMNDTSIVGSSRTDSSLPLAKNLPDDGYNAVGEISCDHVEESPSSKKRKFEEGPAKQCDDDDVVTVEEVEETFSKVRPVLKINPDGTAEQEDTIRLWEPGYKERYYRQKFGVELNDSEFRKNLTKYYVEGLSWVLQYYYQGTPSWQWFYPYHFAPFAADFEDVSKMDIRFTLGQPFKPFEQLMGVFPAASRTLVPAPFQLLMTEQDSPIIDFYPSVFEIDMNGKRMAWQGVALLPFIEQDRLLDAMKACYKDLTEEEVKRNQWGSNVIFASDQHPIYPFYESLYGKRQKQDPIPINSRMSSGISGSVLRNPDCLPGSTYYCPLANQELPDIRNDRSLSALYFFPKQITPHKSCILPGATRIPRVLTQGDLEIARNGGRGRSGWDRAPPMGRGGNWANGGVDRGSFHSRNVPYGESQNFYRGSRADDRERAYGGRGCPPPTQASWMQYPSTFHQYGGYGAHSGGRPLQNYAGHGSTSNIPPPRSGPPQYSYGSTGGYGSYDSGNQQVDIHGYYGGAVHQVGRREGGTLNSPMRGRGRGWVI